MSTALSRHAFAIAALATALACGAGCAKDATAVSVWVDVDATVPPILIIRTAVARADDPARQAAANRTSPYASDAADRPGPFVFPVDLSVTIDESFAGPVVITIEGLDWDSNVVTARGEGPATVVAQKTTAATVTMTAVAVGGSDGGSD
jgi:hypothetical protein